MRVAVVVLLLAAAGAADDLVSPGDRWVEPRGNAAGSYRSSARPVTGPASEAWRLEPGRIRTPIVHWGGTGYVVIATKTWSYLVAFRLDTGRELARRRLDGHVEGTPLVVWDGLVVVQAKPADFVGYRLKDGERLHRSWRRHCDDAPQPASMTVRDGVLYYRIAGKLFEASLDHTGRGRILPEDGWRHWPKGDSPPCPPTLVGPCLLESDACDRKKDFTVERDGETRTLTVAREFLALYATPIGEERDTIVPPCFLKPLAEAPGGGSDTVDAEFRLGPHHVLVYLPPERPLETKSGVFRNAVRVPYRREGKRIVLSPEKAHYFQTPMPILENEIGTLALGSRGSQYAWALLAPSGKKGVLLARSDRQPDLFRSRPTPTFAQHVIYFGAWAYDLKTRKVCWKLDLEVAAPPVPADGLVLLVSGDTIVAIK